MQDIKQKKMNLGGRNSENKTRDDDAEPSAGTRQRIKKCINQDDEKSC